MRLFCLILLSLSLLSSSFAQSRKVEIFSLLYQEQADAPRKYSTALRFSGEQLARDLQLVYDIQAQCAELLERFPGILEIHHQTDLFTPEKEDEIRAALMSFLNYRDVLLRVMKRYSHYELMEEELDRKPALLLSFGSAIFLHHMVGELILVSRDYKLAWKKLNEGDIAWDLEPNLLSAMMKTMVQPSTRRGLEEAYLDYKKVFPAYDEKSELTWLHSAIESSYRFFKRKSMGIWKTRFRIFTSRIKDFLYRPYYHIQAAISAWIGHFRYLNPEPLITENLVQSMLKRLKPGDILLERRNFYLSNIILPGYWPHALMYIGDAETMNELGLMNEPEISTRIKNSLEWKSDLSSHRFIEALAHGVVLSTEKERAEADGVVVLRPLVGKDIIREAIKRAFTHIGKHYDFEFDLSSADKIICSEVIYRAYGSNLKFPLTKILGRYTLPPVNIAMTYVNEHQKPNPQLDFVLFYKGISKDKKAYPTNAQDFIETMRSGKSPLNATPTPKLLPTTAH